jgi:hypothetical protein
MPKAALVLPCLSVGKSKQINSQLIQKVRVKDNSLFKNHD